MAKASFSKIVYGKDSGVHLIMTQTEAQNLAALLVYGVDATPAPGIQACFNNLRAAFLSLGFCGSFSEPVVTKNYLQLYPKSTNPQETAKPGWKIFEVKPVPQPKFLDGEDL